MSSPTQTQTQTKPDAKPNANAGTPVTGPAANANAKPDAKPEVTLDELDAVVVLTPDLAKETAPVRSRSERQTKMDEIAKRLHEQWTKAGSPSQWPKIVQGGAVATYFVEPNKASDLKNLIKRAATFHDLRVKWGGPMQATEKLVTAKGLPKEYIGREVVSFAIIAKRPRPTETKPADK